MVEQHYLASTREKEQEFADPDAQALLIGPAEHRHHYRGLSRDWAHMALELAVQRYSGGEPMELVEAYADYALPSSPGIFRRTRQPASSCARGCRMNTGLPCGCCRWRCCAVTPSVSTRYWAG